MKKKNVFNILFWILLAIGIGLLIWKIFGNTPSDLTIMLTFTLMLMFKIWSVSDDLKDFKHNVKISFNNMRNDFNKVKIH